MTTHFDNIAAAYDRSLLPLPEKYIKLIHDECHIKFSSKIIDLACGSGLLTFPLSTFSNQVEGLDSSAELIAIATARDVANRITWICMPVEDLFLPEHSYDLIISYESFHLLPDPKLLVRRCLKALKPTGVLAIGWVQFAWELPLQDIIIKTFQKHGIIWGQWNYSPFPLSKSLLAEQVDKFASVMTKNIEVDTSYRCKDIVDFLASINKTSCLNTLQRKALATDLTNGIKYVTDDNGINGKSVYTICYVQKL